ncbi:hypothetical protein LV79_000173 [Actinokineospora globicatena]|nr:hypothetical protein [Actinokineospora globicatena]
MIWRLSPLRRGAGQFTGKLKTIFSTLGVLVYLLDRRLFVELLASLSGLLRSLCLIFSRLKS